MAKTTQQLYNDYKYEKNRLLKIKADLEADISDNEEKVKQLNEYNKKIKKSNDEIKPLVDKFMTIGDYLKEVRPEGKPMDNGDFITNSENIKKCSTYLSNLSAEVEKEIERLKSKITKLKSTLRSTSSNISYYSKLISGLSI